jgi:hypothetical protein
MKRFIINLVTFGGGAGATQQGAGGIQGALRPVPCAQCMQSHPHQHRFAAPRASKGKSRQNSPSTPVVGCEGALVGAPQGQLPQ